MPLAARQFFDNGGSQLYVVRIVSAGASTADATQSVGGKDIRLVAAGAGAWAQDMKVVFKENEFDASRYNISIYINKNPSGAAVYDDTPDEFFSALGLNEDGEKFYADYLNQYSSLLSVDLTKAPSFTPTEAADIAGAEFILDGGTDSAAGDPPPLTDPARVTNALATLEGEDEISLLIVPGTGKIEDPATRKNVTIAILGATEAAESYFYIVDPPGRERSAGELQEEAKALAAAAPTRYAGLYYPFVGVPNPYSKVSGSVIYVTPAGMIAGLMARVDNERGVWKAPAGTEATLRGVVALADNVTDEHQDKLNPVGVNCIRTFAASGTVVWGARTTITQSNPEWRYVNVVRLTQMLRKSLYRGTQWTVFEGNDQPLWDRVVFNIDGFMRRLHAQGAFQGATPDEAYIVKCDAENNPQFSIDNGELNILVAFAALKPAEFVIITLRQKLPTE